MRRAIDYVGTNETAREDNQRAWEEWRNRDGSRMRAQGQAVDSVVEALTADGLTPETAVNLARQLDVMGQSRTPWPAGVLAGLAASGKTENVVANLAALAASRANIGGNDLNVFQGTGSLNTIGEVTAGMAATAASVTARGLGAALPHSLTAYGRGEGAVPAEPLRDPVIEVIEASPPTQIGGRGVSGARPLPPSLVIDATMATDAELWAASQVSKMGRGPVVIRDPIPGRRTSDLLVDGAPYDIYSPETSNPGRIISSMAKKNTQCTGIVLDLSNSSVDVNALGDVLARVRGAGATNIKDVIILGR